MFIVNFVYRSGTHGLTAYYDTLASARAAFDGFLSSGKLLEESDDYGQMFSIHPAEVCACTLVEFSEQMKALEKVEVAKNIAMLNVQKIVQSSPGARLMTGGMPPPPIVRN